MSVIDYAVVGGGVAGTYCAWRLKQAYPKKNIVLFEYSNRIGGRLLTTKLPGTTVNAELGGMRYNPNEHVIFAKLVDHLNLATIPFPMGSADDPSGQNNLAYFRRQSLHIKDMGNSDKVPYNVDWSEKNKTPGELQAQIIKTLVPDWQDLKPDDWFNVKIFDKFLWEYGFWNLLYHVLSPEAYLYLKYGSGYDTNVSNGNAVVLLPTGIDYSSTNPYLTLAEGMNAFPKALADQFQTLYKGDLRKNHRLHSIVRGDDKIYNLKFFQTETDENGKTSDTVPPKPIELDAEHVILSMPRAALELIEWKQWKANDFLKNNLDSVLMQGAVKVHLAYDYAWWKSLGLISGRSITDLPIRQTYYFTSLEDMDPKKISKKPALLMASYNDIETIPFWKGLEAGELFDGPAEHRATKAVVHEAHKQVAEMHGQRELPLPYAAAYRDWSEKIYGGGWHCWKANYNYKEIMEQMRHPISDEKVYICGEAYSNDQGWAEGALETAEQMLTDDLKVPPHETTSDWKPDYLRRLRY